MDDIEERRVLATRLAAAASAHLDDLDRATACARDLPVTRRVARVLRLAARRRGAPPRPRLRASAPELKALEAGWPSAVSGWTDRRSINRSGSWRERTAYLNGKIVFEVDYAVCPRCGIGWVEEPYTEEALQRCGLAQAALAALRAELVGVAWHTAGGHLPSAKPFWDAVADQVLGWYAPRGLCDHLIP